MHAEATSEKRAMGFYLDGRVTAVWGTHTHVQTSDAEVLPEGTGYLIRPRMTDRQRRARHRAGAVDRQIPR